MSGHRIRRQVVEELSEETLLLADEARAAFDMRSQDGSANDRVSAELVQDGAPIADDGARIALSIEGLRTTTRLMNLLAWLLNQRAFLAGELSEAQVRRCGSLAVDRRADPLQMAQLALATRALIRESERLYARAARLDDQLQRDSDLGPARDLQDRLSSAFSKR